MTGRKFSIGIKSVTLDAVTLTPSATIAFNSVRPRLHLDTQIESPAQNNNALTLPEKSAGDALQFQLFAPTMAGSQFNAIQLELSLQGKKIVQLYQQQYVRWLALAGIRLRSSESDPVGDHPCVCAE